MVSFSTHLLKCVILASCLLSPTLVKAQIVRDTTLPVNSIVTQSGNTYTITGGTTAGNNLFHSFNQFNVPTASTALFNNALNIQNIFSRVTGGSVSNIDGVLKTNGNANLFLINPKGIIFGSNARLDVGGSFLASTASSLKFSDGTNFSATNPDQPLLTVSVPVGLQFSAGAGSIVDRTVTNANGIVGLQVQPNRTLALVGGDLNLVGTQITATQGRIELGSVSGDGLVSVNQTANNLTLGYDGVRNFGNIQLQQATVSASGAGGGNIQIIGDRLTLTGKSSIVADTLADQNGGTIDIKAQQLKLQDGAFVSASTFGSGASGNITVTAPSIEVTGIGELQKVLDDVFENKIHQPSEIGSGFFVLSFGSGAAGKLTISTDKLSLRSGAFLSTAPFGTGPGGTMQVNASDSIEIIGSQFFGDSFKDGDAGKITVQTGKLTASEGGAIASSAFGGGVGGTINVKATESIELIGTTPDGRFKSGIFSNAYINATKTPGNLTIETKRLTVRDGAGITAGTYGAANGVTINVKATDLLELIGTSANGKELTNLVTVTQGKGNAGDITVTTSKLVVRDGALISTSTSNTGLAGKLTINAADSVELSGTSADGRNSSSLKSDASLTAPPSSYFSPQGRADIVGSAGDMTINTSNLIVRDNAEISVSAQGVGKAGNLQVRTNSIKLDNGSITGVTASGEGANITLQAQNLQLRHGSSITTNATDKATGGNITLNTDTIVLLENSSITTNAIKGRGGNIKINTQGLFRSPDSTISASSDLGINGIVAIKTPDVQLQNSLVQQSVKFANPDQVVANSCLSRRNVERGSFTVTGNGSLQPNPYNASVGSYSITGVRSLPKNSSAVKQVIETTNNQKLAIDEPWKLGNPIQEAQGILITKDGRTIIGTKPQLVAIASADNLICDANISDR